MPIPVVLYVLIGLAGTVLIVGRAAARLWDARQGRVLIAVVSAAALAVWIACSWILGLLNFGVAMAMAHTPVRQPGLMAEGWPIYAATVLYALVGAALFVLLGRIPPKRAAA